MHGLVAAASSPWIFTAWACSSTETSRKTDQFLPPICYVPGFRSRDIMEIDATSLECSHPTWSQLCCECICHFFYVCPFFNFSFVSCPCLSGTKPRGLGPSLPPFFISFIWFHVFEYLYWRLVLLLVPQSWPPLSPKKIGKRNVSWGKFRLKLLQQWEPLPWL